MMGQKMITGTHGIPAIIRAAKQFQILVTEGSLRHKLGIDCQELTWIDVCRAARAVGLRAKYYEEISGDLQTLPVPILVCLANQWSVIEKVETEYWWRYDVATEKFNKELLPTANNSKYNLPIILLAVQELQITDVKFGFNWFLPSILRHINQLRDV